MSMGNVWAFPALPYDVTLDAMKALALKLAALTRAYPGYTHPLDLNHTLEPEYLRLAATLWAGTPDRCPAPLRDRDIFDLLGFDFGL